MLGSGMLVVGVWAGLTAASKAVGGGSSALVGRIAQIVVFAAMGLFFWPYFAPAVISQ